MADVQAPSNVSSVTFVTSGVKAVSAGRINGITTAEAQSLIGGGNTFKGDQIGEWYGFRLENANLSTGNTSFLAPATLTSITMSATPYAVSGGRITNVPAADATLLFTQGFNLVNP